MKPGTMSFTLQLLDLLMLITPARTGFLISASYTKSICPLPHEAMPPILDLLDLLMLTVDYPRAGAVPIAFAFRFMKTGDDYGFCRRWAVFALNADCSLCEGRGELIGVVKKSCSCSRDDCSDGKIFVFGNDMLLGRESAAGKALTRGRDGFWRPNREILPEIVSILLHNPDCQPDVRHLFDDSSAANSPEGDMVSMIVEESELFP